MNTRRDFLKSVTLGAAATALPSLSSFGAGAGSGTGVGPTSYAVFTKHFLGLSNEQLADTLAGLGIKAIEAPVRPKGGTHVDVAKIEDELPKFVEVLKKRDIQIAVLTSGINAVSDEQHTDKILRTAKALGIPRFRTDWYIYDLKKPIWPQLDEFKGKVKDLVAFSKEVGIQPCYQNHSGKDRAGAPIWDIASLMRDYKPEDFSWCFDIMHATIEGSTSWPLEVNLIRDHLAVAYFKNFNWDPKKVHKPAPLGEGVVAYKDYIDMLKKSNWSGPVSLHIEYLEGSVKDKGYLEKAIEVTKRDMEVLKGWWA